MTLIEMLVCLFLLSLMMGGLLINQVHALRSASRDAGSLIAIEQLNLIVAQIHLFAADPPQNIITRWQQQCHTRLANGVGRVSGAFPDYRIQISWGPKPHHCPDKEGVNHTCLTYHMRV